MKLLHCNKCLDWVALSHDYRQCRCGESSGFYTTYENMIYSGDAAVIGIDNHEFYKSVENIPLDGKGVYFNAYVIPYYCDSATKVANSLSVYHKTKNYGEAVAYHDEWIREITNVRIKNPILKLLYIMFKKWIFVSIKEDEVKPVPEENSKKTKYDEKIYSLSPVQLTSIYIHSFYYGAMSGVKKTKKNKEVCWDLAKYFAQYPERWTEDKELDLDTFKKV